MSTAAAYAKDVNEYRRTFTQLPSILIQDPARHCAYHMSSEDLERFRADSETWSRVDESTVTFVIPGDQLVDDVPPFLQAPELDPSVLVRFPNGKSAYFITFEQLQEFKIAQPTESFDEWVSFVIPRGTELVEELPTLRRALLQSNTQ